MSNKILRFADFKNGNSLQDPKKHALTTKGDPKPKKEKSFDQVKRSNLGQLTVTQPAYSKSVQDPIMEGVIEDNTVKIDDLKIQLSKLTKVFKLMSSGNFDVIKLSKDFDSCETENDIESLYQQYITSEEQK